MERCSSLLRRIIRETNKLVREPGNDDIHRIVRVNCARWPGLSKIAEQIAAPQQSQVRHDDDGPGL